MKNINANLIAKLENTLSESLMHKWQSLLEQAVGRARLLRYDCTVKVFAGFPVEQAEFVK